MDNSTPPQTRRLAGARRRRTVARLPLPQRHIADPNHSNPSVFRELRNISSSRLCRYVHAGGSLRAP